MSHLDLVALVVRDYDAAIRFFVDVSAVPTRGGHRALTNDGRPKRWVVVRPDGGHTGILLARADGGHQASIVGRQFAGRVGLFLRVDDFDSTYQAHGRGGVEFTSAPRDEPYGRVAVFLDLEGNRWDLLGPDPDSVRVDKGEPSSEHARMPCARTVVSRCTGGTLRYRRRNRARASRTRGSGVVT